MNIGKQTRMCCKQMFKHACTISDYINTIDLPAN